MFVLHFVLSLLAWAAVASNPLDYIRLNCGSWAFPRYGFRADDLRYFNNTPFRTRLYQTLGRTPNSVKYNEIYDSHRWGTAGPGFPLIYTIPVPPGTYSVSLLFSENWVGAERVGVRVIDAEINGVTAATDLDVFKEAGKSLFRPVVVTVNRVTATKGKVIIKITSKKQNPFISGIIVNGKYAAAIVDGVSIPSPSAAASPTAASPTASIASSASPRASDSASSSPTQSATPSASLTPKSPPLVGSGLFRTVPAIGRPRARHEACAVMVAGKVYLIGGRRRNPVDVFDPTSRVWTRKRTPPVEIHHMQCLSYLDRFVYIGGSWHGGYPKERTHDKTFVYDTVTDAWTTKAGLPPTRRRGGGAFVLYQGKMYLAMGNRGGHGRHATTLGEFDSYDPQTDTWTKLQEAPFPRDHVGGAIVDGKLCIGGGRDGGVADFWNAPVPETVCYDFATSQWQNRTKIPLPRAGAATGATCQGYMMVAGGEGKTHLYPRGNAYARVDLYDAKLDKYLNNTKLVRKRHGSGLAIADCACGNIYIPSGSGNQGGWPELSTIEAWSPDGKRRDC